MSALRFAEDVAGSTDFEVAHRDLEAAAEFRRFADRTVTEMGVHAVRAALADALARVTPDNAQGELYLPDALTVIEGEVGALVAPDASVVQGVNTRVHLAECEAVIQDRLRHELMVDGVTMPDPSRVLVDAGVTVGQDLVKELQNDLEKARASGKKK